MILGVQDAQVNNVITVFNKFLNAEKFDTIVEIGPAWGAVTVILGLYGILHKSSVSTFDLLKPWEFTNNNGLVIEESMLRDLKIDWTKGDIWTPEISNKIISLISGKGRCLLLCDGGNKAKEFNMFSQYLKPNDVIMAHDYGYDHETLKRKSSMIVIEIQYSDVKDSCDKHGLEFIYSDDFDPAAWLCMRKK